MHDNFSVPLSKISGLSEVKDMSCIAFPGKYDRSLLTGEPRPVSEEVLQHQSSLSDLVDSNEVFLSHLEAIHYLDFPGW